MTRALLAITLFPVALAAAEPVKSYEGSLTIPTYEHSRRETEPPLFANSTLTGMYPFTTYVMPFKPDGPQPKSYRAIFLENEYLKLTYLPELGGRIFSLYDKIRRREVFYRNDVIKPAPYNPRLSWPQSGLELTGPHDLHMMTLYGEPFWAYKIVPHDDGAISLVLAENDPVYQMRVSLTATLHPGIAALEISVFCYNARDGRMPQMLWINTALPATPKTRFIYPMSRTVGHTTAEIADWPLYNGIDYSWDRNNTHMLGVFGIDIYDNFQGAYQFENDYGVFRYADRRVVQGMKLWTFGYGEGSKGYENGYTDHAGPYVEVQSGRYVWDGHYEWVAPHKVESWSEWWVPVAGTGGLTTINRDLALSVDGTNLSLAATRVISGAQLVVRSNAGELLRTAAKFDPAKTLRISLPAGKDLAGLSVSVAGADGHSLFDYHKPSENPGRREYTPFTKPLEQTPKPPEKMSAEELTLAAEFKLKELDGTGARNLLEQALKLDPGFSRAHVLAGIDRFNRGEYAAAVEQLEKAIERDPYSSEAYYYLAISQFALGRDQQAERNLYYVWTDSPYFGEREYWLGRQALLRQNHDEAAVHLAKAVDANGNDLLSLLTLAMCDRERGARVPAEDLLSKVERIDPANPLAAAERYFLTNGEAAKQELLRLLGGQSQEAISASGFYRGLGRWNAAIRILRLVEQDNHDPWGTPPEFYYVLAYCRHEAGEATDAAASLRKALAAAGNIDRFPYRDDSEPPLVYATEAGPADAVAHFALACLLYFRGQHAVAIHHWEQAVESDPQNFSARRALGLAYAEQGAGIDRAATQLEKAVSLNPAHLRTLNDLSALYARAGRFDDQLAVLQNALLRSPNDDDLAEGILTADLNRGRYDDAARVIASHPFAPRHRTYGLRDKYRLMRYALGAQAYQRKDFAAARDSFESALRPPVSLGVDDFQSQASPRQAYYLGRALEALGRGDEAHRTYEKAVAGVERLSGDRDSWNSENYFMVLSLERLGRADDARRLEQHFENFAQSERDDKSAERRAEARYLLGLIRKRAGQNAEAQKLMAEAVEAQPDFIAARLELRGDVLDPLPVH